MACSSSHGPRQRNNPVHSSSNPDSPVRKAESKRHMIQTLMCLILVDYCTLLIAWHKPCLEYRQQVVVVACLASTAADLVPHHNASFQVASTSRLPPKWSQSGSAEIVHHGGLVRNSVSLCKDRIQRPVADVGIRGLQNGYICIPVSGRGVTDCEEESKQFFSHS